MSLNSIQPLQRISLLRYMSSSRHQQAGFSLVSGIFILVILAALGAFMMTISGLQQNSSALDVMGSRAYHAARSGIQWGTLSVINNGACPPSPSTLSGMAGTLGMFNVQVSCETFNETQAGVAIALFRLTSTASSGVVNTSVFVQRQLQVTLAP